VDWLVEDNVSGRRAVSISITSALKMKTARSSETLASTNQSTRQLNPKEHNENLHRSENLKSHISHSYTLSSAAGGILKNRKRERRFMVGSRRERFPGTLGHLALHSRDSLGMFTRGHQTLFSFIKYCNACLCVLVLFKNK
jgi:hypothetical protein